jgi:hypothetical protein
MKEKGLVTKEQAQALYEKYAGKNVFIEEKGVSGMISGYNWEYNSIDLIVAITDDPHSFSGWHSFLLDVERLIINKNNDLGYCYLEESLIETSLIKEESES